MLFDDPTRFNAWILVSPASWNDGYILKRANAFAGGKTSVILMRGAEDADIVEGTDRLAAVLSKKPIELTSMTFATPTIPRRYANASSSITRMSRAATGFAWRSRSRDSTA